MERQRYQLCFGSCAGPVECNEDGSPCYETFAAPDEPEDDYTVVDLRTGLLLAMQAEADESNEPVCPEYYRIVDEASGWTVGDLCRALTAHRNRCVICDPENARFGIVPETAASVVRTVPGVLEAA